MKILKIKNSWFKDSDLRLDAAYHLSDGLLTIKRLNNSPYEVTELKNCTENIYRGNIFRRIFVDEAKKGYKYLTASDMNKSDIRSGKFISKKYTKVANLMLDKGWVLISCSGTIGSTVYTNEEFENVVGTHDLIRVIPNNTNILSGFLYAYLTSKYGYGLLTQSGYGGVVQHIEPHHIENLPVPIFPEEKQQEIHQLIIEASELRVEANRLLNEAQSKITSKLNLEKNRISEKVSILDIISSHQKRFESQYHKSIGSYYRNQILNYDYILLKDASEDIFRPGIFKRNYVKQGVDFLGGSDITKSIPDSDKKLSKRNTPNFKELTLKEDWILVTCGGTIGTSVLVNSYLATKLASQHILRVIPKNIRTGYLFAFLSSEIGVKVIQSFTYGSVIPQIEPHHLGLVPIPVMDNEFMEMIHLNVMRYKLNTNEAILKENQAIALIEKEIDLWQK